MNKETFDQIVDEYLKDKNWWSIEAELKDLADHIYKEIFENSSTLSPELSPLANRC
jgi:hypothetical protein